MRRHEREVTDRNRIEQVLSDCKTCRLALSDGDAPYIVPLCYGYALSGAQLTLYFHCAVQGKKLSLIKKCPQAGFEIDMFRQLVPAGQACGFTAEYASLIGKGTVSVLEDPAEKRAALCLIMRHYTGKSEWDIPAAALNGVCVLKLSAGEYSCKENI